MMTLISLKRLFVAPVFDETFSSTQLLSLANLRSWCLLAFVVLDFFIYGMLTGSDSIRQDALLFFALVNIGMLSLDLALNQFWIARRRHCWMGLLGFSVVIESFTVIVWIQLTGSLSSYFLFVPYLLICAYRIVGNYRLSLLCTVSSVVFFSLGFLFEELELLRRGGLFEVPLGGFYTISSFRRVVFFSVLMTYPAVFMMVNLHILRIREKDEALAKAKKKLGDFFQSSQLGRYSGRILNRKYELQELLGRGGMGEVYKGLSLVDGEMVAIKLVHGQWSHDSQVFERFQREALVAMRLPEEYIARVYEFEHLDDGTPYMAMEYLPGEDFSGYLKRRVCVPASELVPLVLRLGKILEAAHNLGVIHRDLKPGNIFLTSDKLEKARLLDFGVCRLQDNADSRELTQTAQVIGTPGYWAPEQAAGMNHSVGPAADVFALGALFYRALTGTQAFPMRAKSSAMEEVFNRYPPMVSSLHPGQPMGIDWVMVLAMAKRVDDRYQSPMEFAQAFVMAVNGDLPEEEVLRAKALNPVFEDAETSLLGQ